MMSMLGRWPTTPGPTSLGRHNQINHPLTSQRTKVVHSPLVVRAQDNEKPNFGDELLDFMYAGKKLRKWYGEEGMVLPKDGGRDLKEEQPAPDEDDEEYRGPKDHTLVLDADSSPMAEQVLLQLILSRAKVKAFAKNVETAKAGFGPYVEITADPTENPKALARALRNVNAVVCCSKITPQIVSTLRSAGVPHLVVLSMVGAPPQGFSLFGNGEAKLLAEPSREQAASSSGVSTTIIRVGPLLDVPGGQSELRIAGGNEAVGGSVSREDAARMLAEAAFFNRKGAAGVVVCGVGGVGPGQPPEDYAALMSKLMASPVS